MHVRGVLASKDRGRVALLGIDEGSLNCVFCINHVYVCLVRERGSVIAVTPVSTVSVRVKCACN